MKKKIIIAGTIAAAALAMTIKKELNKKEIFFAVSNDTKEAFLHFNNSEGLFEIKTAKEGLYFIPKKEGALFLIYEGITKSGEEFIEEYVFQNDEYLNPTTYRINNNDELEEF